MPLLLDACPSFREPWNCYVGSDMYDPDLLYLHLGECARHIVELLRRDAVSELDAVFDVVERFHVDGDAYVREAATIGLLEGIQNNCLHHGVRPELLLHWLLPETRRWWDKLNAFWAGDSATLRQEIK